MFRNPTPLTVFAGALALMALATPAGAWPFGPAKPAAAKTDPNAPRKATPDQRAAAARLDPLSRAAFWQRELGLDAADTEASIGLSAALRALGKYDEAADAADRAVILAPKNVEALLESARDHIAAGHGFYAIQPLKDAATLTPKDWRPYSLMGIALEQSERPDEALAAYNHALKLSPNNPAALSNLALFYATRGDTAQAESLLRRAAADPRSTSQERQNLALVLGLEGKTAEAERLMRQDLPPEAADANLAYFKGEVAHPTGRLISLPAKPEPAPAERTWDSVERSDAKGG
jgi:Flp pilus assembly protein TadD